MIFKEFKLKFLFIAVPFKKNVCDKMKDIMSQSFCWWKQSGSNVYSINLYHLYGNITYISYTFSCISRKI